MGGVGTAARGAGPPERDWLLRLGRGSPLGALGLGLGALVLFLAVFALWNGVGSSLAYWRHADGSLNGEQLFLEVVNAVLFGYALGAYAVARRGAAEDLERLAPVLDGREDDSPARCWILRSPRWLLPAALAIGVLGGLVMVNDPRVWDGEPRPALPDPTLLWVFLRNFLLSSASSLLFLTDVRLTRGFARLGADHAVVDLLDMRRFDPFVRKGQRSVVIAIVYSSLLSIFWVRGSAASLNVPILVLIAGLATAAFLLPLSGVRQRIVAAKRAELARVNEAIRGERADVLDPPADAAPGPRLANLIAYRGLVEGVHEWPVSAPALLRFGFFLLLGLGSWLGAALVERMLESVLG